jgi:hypothetical protein
VWWFADTMCRFVSRRLPTGAHIEEHFDRPFRFDIGAAPGTADECQPQPSDGEIGL